MSHQREKWLLEKIDWSANNWYTHNKEEVTRRYHRDGGEGDPPVEWLADAFLHSYHGAKFYENLTTQEQQILTGVDTKHWWRR